MPITRMVTPLPDVEAALLFALVPMEPNIRFVTVMPSGDLPKITARIRRVSGTVGTHINQPGDIDRGRSTRVTVIQKYRKPRGMFRLICRA
jgi:hypothetical protein